MCGGERDEGSDVASGGRGEGGEKNEGLQGLGESVREGGMPWSLQSHCRLPKVGVPRGHLLLLDLSIRCMLPDCSSVDLQSYYPPGLILKI